MQWVIFSLYEKINNKDFTDVSEAGVCEERECEMRLCERGRVTFACVRGREVRPSIISSISSISVK